jgi:hypothetical protein
MLSCVDLESRIPKGHPMRKIADAPLQAIEPWSGDRYAADGRPPVPPEMLLGTSLKSFKHKDMGEHAPPTGGGSREEDVQGQKRSNGYKGSIWHDEPPLL